jgi:sodium/proline symporter
MPHILIRFMAVRDEKELKKSKAMAISWVALSLFFACFIGVLGRAYLAPNALVESGSERVFIELIKKLFIEDIKMPFIAGLFLCGILAAIMSTADSQLLVSASSMSEDIYKGLINKNADAKKVLCVSRITVIVIAVIAYIIALNPNNTIMGLVSNAWAGLGAAFGPLVLMSLFWKRCNFQGAVAGIVTGALTVILWDYIPMIGGQTIGQVTGLYSLVVGFALSLFAIGGVSLCTKAPSAEMLQEFEDVKNNNI